MLNKLWTCCKYILYFIVGIISIIILGPYLSFIFTVYYWDDSYDKYREYINRLVGDRYGYIILDIVVVLSIIPLTIFFYLCGLYMFMRDEIVYKLILNKSYWLSKIN